MKKEIKLLQEYMKKHHYDAFLAETADDHQSEYVGDYFKVRAWLSGFSGSAGTLLVTINSAYLWTDGRYFIQAEKELAGSGIELMRMGQKGVETLEEKIAHLGKQLTLALDLKTVSDAFVSDFVKLFPEARLVHDTQAIETLWQDRPKRSCEPVWDYDIAYCGKSRTDKIHEVRACMKQKNAAGMLLTGLDDIAWLLNIRGNDVACNPVTLSYVLIDMQHVTLYIQAAALTEQMKPTLIKDGISLRPYDSIFDDLELYDAGCLWYDPKRTNAALIQRLNKQTPLLKESLPVVLMKSVKNEQEIENTKLAHLYDGLAITKWMYWLKETIQNHAMTEIEISDHLEALRAANPSYIEPSFDTICAYNANAAMMHYKAHPESQAVVKNEGMILVDSGGQYLEGTTDITRTIILGKTPDIYKEHFTLALKSMLRLQSAHFLEGCTGLNLDILARGPLWNLGLDYQCGTGHGVGQLLNVHEGPNGFRWRVLPNRNEMAVLQPGMITTDEPGVYIEGSHGVRHENELLCVFETENFYGRFLTFEPITYAPIDLDGVIAAMLNEEEKAALNAYHALVYQKLSDHLDDKMKVWLKHYTRAI